MGLGGFGFFLGLWVTMMVAMMLPSAAPAVFLVAEVSVRRSAPVFFLAGYFLLWSVFGVLAYALVRGIDSLGLHFLAWSEGGPLVAGGTVVAAGVYQLAPLKRRCLSRCRNPLGLVVHRWREGLLGPGCMGLEHGAACVGCCAGLMAILFALGLMSLLWMGLVTALVFAEKVLSRSRLLPRLVAPVLIALGIWVALAPGSVPA